MYATPVKIEAMEVSLAEELSAIRKKTERMKSDREKTEKMLKEKDMVMEIQMKELENRGQIQKMLETELDRIYRLNQLHVQSIVSSDLTSNAFSFPFMFLNFYLTLSVLEQRVSPIRSLREKEEEKKADESPSQVNHNLHFP